MSITERDIKKAIEQIAQAESADQLDELRRQYLGRKGKVTAALRSIKDLPEGKRAKAGQLANKAADKIEEALKSRQSELTRARVENESKEHPLDLTAPGEGHQLGYLHPLEDLQQELIHIFWQLGFSVVEGPEIESDWYNFEALNIPADHPARDMQDTFYLENGAIPRTHTSSVQIRHMENNKPPIRIIAPGRVYRNEDEDATHVWAFHQIEGLVVDEGISLADLKGTLLYMLKGMFGEDTEVRLRPNYFPYTEPSLEADASCVVCERQTADCKTCKGTGWVELLGAGMVHPQVLRNVGIDPRKYSGFAFGFGLERAAAIKHQVADLRDFWRPDLRFLEQF